MGEKQCTMCGQKKSLHDFHIKKSSKDGHSTQCKDCIKNKSAIYYEKNREKIREKQKSNPKRKLYSKEYNEEKREEKRKYNKEYKKRNREKINLQVKKRKETDLVFKLKLRVNKSINKAFSKNGIFKNSVVWSKLPYTPERLKEHLEKLWSPEMSWDNFNKYWVIDHVVPQALFPFESFDDLNFQKCWSLYNLRPLNKKDNLLKSSRFMGKIYNKNNHNDAGKDFTIKPWGAEHLWIKTEGYVSKILFITKGSKLSVQHHNFKEETMFLYSGQVKLYYGDDTQNLNFVVLNQKDAFHIPPKLIHSVEAIVDSEIIEISTPELDDIVRHSDLYGRG